MSIRNMVLVIFGFLALGLGAAGMFFPILPTTPFVLVAAACFGTSNQWLYNKLLNAKYFGNFVDNYKNKTGISKGIKIKAIAFLWITLLISGLIFKEMLVLVILFTVGVAVTAHILLIKDKK